MLTASPQLKRDLVSQLTRKLSLDPSLLLVSQVEALRWEITQQLYVGVTENFSQIFIVITKSHLESYDALNNELITRISRIRIN